MSKRGKIDDFARFRKAWVPKPLALAISSLVVGGCSELESVQVVQSVDDCTQKAELTLEQCEAAYQQALEESERTAPRFANLNDCVAQFGVDACQRSYDGSFFTPFMVGWMVSSVVSAAETGLASDRYNPVFDNRNRGRYDEPDYYTASGSPVRASGNGTFRVLAGASSKPQPKAKVMKTVSRGGWGSTASAKSNWSRSGKSSGWGG